MSHACKCPCRPEVSGCLTLDLQAILSHLTWVLGTELESPLRVVCTLNCWPSLCCFYLVLVCVKPQVTHSLPLITHTTSFPLSEDSLPISFWDVFQVYVFFHSSLNPCTYWLASRLHSRSLYSRLASVPCYFVHH